MEEKTVNILAICLITLIFLGIVGMFGYLGWTTYKRESICNDYNRGNTQSIKELILDKSISVDYACPFPLVAQSAKNGDLDMVKFLLENDADATKKFTYRSPKTYPYKIVHTPLFYAVYAQYEKKKINFPMEINEDFIDCLELLIKNGASLDASCGREYNEKATDSLQNIYRKKSPDKQTVREVIKIIDNDLLNDLAKKY